MEIRFQHQNQSLCTKAFALQMRYRDYQALSKKERSAYTRFLEAYPVFGSETFGHKSLCGDVVTIGWAPFGPDLVLDHIVQFSTAADAPLLLSPPNQLFCDPKGHFLWLLEDVDRLSKVAVLTLCYDTARAAIFASGTRENGRKIPKACLGAPDSILALTAAIRAML